MTDSARAVDYLRRIIGLRKRKSRKKTLPINKLNKSLQKNYSDILFWLSSELEKEIKKHILPAAERVKSNPNLQAVDIFNDAFRSLELQSAVLVDTSLKLSEVVISGINKDNKAKWMDSMRKVVGVDISNVVTSEVVQKQLQIMTEENFNLIKSIPENELSKIKTIILQELSQGNFEQTDIKELLEKQFGITKNRARFIAHDQAHKLNASLSRIRNESVGVTEYVWRNSNDLRVRGNPVGFYPKTKYSHWEREGKIFSYDKPPPDGNPGMPIRCRCYAEAVLPKIYDED